MLLQVEYLNTLRQQGADAVRVEIPLGLRSPHFIPQPLPELMLVFDAIKREFASIQNGVYKVDALDCLHWINELWIFRTI